MRRSALLAALLLAAAPLPARELVEVVRIVPLERRGNAFSADFRDAVSSAKVRRAALLVDWWTGPGDDRVGDPEAAETGGFRFRLRRGREWIDLPEAKRDLRLTARIEAPEEQLAGEDVRGDWLVEQVAGEEEAVSVAVEVVYEVPWGKGFALPDLAVAGILLTDLEPDPPSAGTFPLRRDFPEVEAGKAYAARVLLANRGMGDARAPDIGFFLTGADGKGRKALAPAEVGIEVREKEELRVKWELVVPARTKPGLHLLHAVADPRGRIKELNEENNSFSRVIRVVEAR